MTRNALRYSATTFFAAAATTLGSFRNAPQPNAPRTIASAPFADATWIELPDKLAEIHKNHPDADWNNRIGYPAYVVEPGAKLVFAENDSYPSALVRRP